MKTNLNILYTNSRTEWREWLSAHCKTEKEIWFVFPMKQSGEAGISYNDAVEEALCFGWIDSTIKHIDPLRRAQRFTPRNPRSAYSRANIERLIRLEAQGLLHPDIRNAVIEVINTPYQFPADIIKAIKSDPTAWNNYRNMPEPYKRIRVAYIDAARNRPDEFKRRLKSFLSKTKENKLIAGFGGIDKYYNDMPVNNGNRIP